MTQVSGSNPIAKRIAIILIEGFNNHYRLFRECSMVAKGRYEVADWHGIQQAVRNRIQFYDDRVGETSAYLREIFGPKPIDDDTWQQAKLLYIGLLINHKQPELAETFFNSVFCRIMHRTYFHNDFIFVRPAISTEYIESIPPAYRSYYPGGQGLRETMVRIFQDFGWERPFDNLTRDVEHIYQTALTLLGEWPRKEANLQIQVLHSPFYRNKGAYVIGKAVNGSMEYPFAIPVLHSPAGGLYLDTILLDPGLISILFSLSRAYFLVDMEVPSAYVQFLRSIMPGKPRSELYTMLGLGKQGKTMFFRDLIHHLGHSQDQFVVAPGIRGLVMMVFTLPSYPYVFKIIKDKFGFIKEVDHATVRRKYQLVKQVDRVGRMADTLEFSNAAFPRARFSPELIEELQREVPSLLEEDGEDLIIRHLYIERRMEPLNLFLDRAERSGREDLIEQGVKEYGDAIRELASANIFPGDMLWKNFGVTRYGRVVFYDYDEIEYMTDCNFRRIPPAPYPEMELSGEAWYSVGRNDIFPEEFATFLLTSPRIRSMFMKYHADLLDAEFWKQAQADIRDGKLRDFFPYPEALRFCHAYPDTATGA
ncbi:bifunctional isocitrate dehydrogenase kinase/phosphatase [Denitratisoma oestradiolicum]|uniref:Isocitrate dehydrogenase kinase/phosphatase n=1 Tax=Denitratisoma oestradiolicum TaxID=311182 RepID=A0A6S6YJ54_9PROT|nr:bifunctional isocitrate dehydrogenase kinase/phosphatase [Denitratisoma oestradiolicum]TWO81088.1 bifunctional isocitrate dehydrogenase kinase/phosphatase [Denitratisoma oestradiolicum]CAB1367764.1 Isocitrate dehydrogenase kinase/phosphatase [Denitratisoma oestradiolicum]